jgi:predicted aspartyl protease
VKERPSFLKKRSKRLLFLRPRKHPVHDLDRWSAGRITVFWFFSSKKNAFLPLALPIALAGCAATPDQRPCNLGFATELPLSFRQNAFVTPALLDSQPASLMLDTGSEFTVVSKATSDRMNLDIVAMPGQMSGVGGVRGAYVMSADTFQIGRLQGKNLPLMVSDLTLSPGGTPIDGLLGSDFLSSYDVDLDFPQSKARLFKASGSCTGTPTTLAEPLFQAKLVRSEHPLDFRPFVWVLIDGKSLLASVDTGAAHTLIFRNAANRLGLRIEDLVREPHFFARGVGPETPVLVRHVMRPITIGEVTIANLPVALLDETSPDSTDMLLGMDFLSEVHVWLSFSSHTMIMQYPPKPSPPVP